MWLVPYGLLLVFEKPDVSDSVIKPVHPVFVVFDAACDVIGMGGPNSEDNLRGVVAVATRHDFGACAGAHDEDS